MQTLEMKHTGGMSAHDSANHETKDSKHGDTEILREDPGVECCYIHRLEYNRWIHAGRN